MKFLVSFILIIGFVPLIHGQHPVEWKLSSSKVNDSCFRLLLEGEISDGWKVYAEKDEETGIEPVQIQWEQKNIMAGKSSNLSTTIEYADPIFDNKLLKVYADRVILEQLIIVKGDVPSRLPVTISGFSSAKDQFVPVIESTEILLSDKKKSTQEKVLAIDLEKPVSGCGENSVLQGASLWSVFGKGFLGGLLSLLMPCIFPMLPVTVSFFMNKANNRRAGIINGTMYGGFILLLYVAASLPFHLIGNINPQLFNIIATDKWVNLGFFIVFLLFALSLFGLFELKLPGATQSGKRSTTGSIAGIFFMALTLTIVSFSCTGPILGYLLVNSIREVNGAWALTAGMTGFGLALALPFSLFAFFPQWMKKMPRSGQWMNTLKKSLAFIELALALKFLSNADLVEHWGILKREVFIAIWLLITIALGLYLFNIKELIRFGKSTITKSRLFLGVLTLLFAIYLTPGLTQSKYANLKWVSGFPPPLSYSIYGNQNIHGKGLEPDVINDYEKALQLAKEQQRPLLIDFTGWACVNCRKMEENVWTDPGIKKLIDSNFILVSLYVDDRQQLADGRTMGEKWAAFQSRHFGSASQPQYVILSPDEQLLNHPVGYTAADNYRMWLECGFKAYQQLMSKKEL